MIPETLCALGGVLILAGLCALNVWIVRGRDDE